MHGHAMLCLVKITRGEGFYPLYTSDHSVGWFSMFNHVQFKNNPEAQVFVADE
jgi:hypothetical protein